jgi:hypothetical protein
MKARTQFMVALAVVIAAFVMTQDARAKLPGAAQEGPAAPATEVVTPDCGDCGQCGECREPKYCLVYREHHARRKVCCDPCLPAIKTVVRIQDPCTCSPVEVPVCVPGCCTDAPCVTTRDGLFGRSITEFTWRCGFRVRVVMTRSNTIIVHSYGS